MPQTQTQDKTLAAVTTQISGLLRESQQAVYAYLDDHRKVCNANMARLLGYPSPEAWAAVTTSFPTAFVEPESQETLVEAFQDAMRNGNGAAIPVTWRTKSGKPVETDVLLVPMECDGHRYALHFIEQLE